MKYIKHLQVYNRKRILSSIHLVLSSVHFLADLV